MLSLAVQEVKNARFSLFYCESNFGRSHVGSRTPLASGVFQHFAMASHSEPLSWDELAIQAATWDPDFANGPNTSFTKRFFMRGMVGKKPDVFRKFRIF